MKTHFNRFGMRRTVRNMAFTSTSVRSLRTRTAIPLSSDPSLSRVMTTAIPEFLGTVPWHLSMLFLHTTIPPSEYPSKMTAKLYRELLLRTRNQGGSVNFSWSPTQPTNNEPEAYAATAFFASGSSMLIPRIDMANMDAVLTSMSGQSSIKNDPSRDIRLYVCTHGARDCRCGTTGAQVAEALRAEASRRPDGNRIHVAETAHVGGHKYAANVLIYPRGDWLGMITPRDVPSALEAIVRYHDLPHTLEAPPLLAQHWRGRMGLDKEDQISLYNRYSMNQPVGNK